jgi:hypothetical protein
VTGTSLLPLGREVTPEGDLGLGSLLLTDWGDLMVLREIPEQSEILTSE